MEEEYLHHNGTAYLKEQDEKAEEKAVKRKKRSGEGSFALLQAIACAILLLAFLLLKSIGGEVYEKVRDWYTAHLSDTILIGEASQNEASQSEALQMERDESAAEHAAN